ncbi:MAG: nickel-responsive transcriptional regulator NikR [Candidatus Euphemobacter frigidus]|nr:nickel-responsive transcriptional regulator NikR [Candidatus Euphemobacter frigidus]MDP8276437.1 nickel-responsive transcriptional regulator NikR [Candidatus Euphemobacter frigidus]
MGNLVRFGVSLEKKLLDQFDASIRRKGYTNRSEALRDLVRADLVVREWDKGEDVVGVIMLVFDHHHRELQNKITDLQHRHLSAIISTQHVHLDYNNCLEVIILKGKAGQVRRLADLLQAQRGIKHCSLNMSTTGRSIA